MSTAEWRGTFLCSAAAATLAAGMTAVGQEASTPGAVARIGQYVERYYARAQSVVADETVILQPMRRDYSSDGFPRRLVYELRVDWNPQPIGDEPAATVTRVLLKVNGKPQRPGDEPDCLDPRDVSPEPLAFLLADRRHKFAFSVAGMGHVDGRAAVMVDYRSLHPEPPKAVWDGECASIDLPGRSRGRVWANPETGEILRFDEHLTGMVDVPVPRAQQRRGAPASMTIERADMSIRYRPVTFREPDEVLLLPAAIETVVVVQNSGTPRLRITQTFDNYRRFVTESRIVQ